jgi:hypothetical protein
VLALVAALAALQAPNPCQDPLVPLRCPDLTMSAPSDLRLGRSPSGRVLLRMANHIVNVGLGAAELFAERSGPRTMTARQVIADQTGVRRRYVTGAEVYYTSVPTRGGSYWKFEHAARFELWTQSADGRVAGLLRTGPKLRYCLRDLQRVFSPVQLPGTPRRAFFPACNQSRTKRSVTLGTSVGWADVYPASYPGNYIDVTGLGGCFVVVQRADPENHVVETNELNNASARVVRLPYRGGRGAACPPYVA